MSMGHKVLVDAVLSDLGLDVFLDGLKRDQGEKVSREVSALASCSTAEGRRKSWISPRTLWTGARSHRSTASYTIGSGRRCSTAYDWTEHARGRSGGVLVIDDTLIEKSGREMEGTGYLYDHSQHRNV